MLLCKCTFMQHSDPLMRELIPAINEIEKYGLPPGFIIADRDKVLEKNLIKITSQQRFPTGTLRFNYQDLKPYMQRPARAETLLRSKHLKKTL